jgi:hypothetical protein
MADLLLKSPALDANLQACGAFFFVSEQKTMKRQMLVIALAAAVVAPSTLAVTDAQIKAVKKSLNSVPVPELPAKAAELVTQAAKEDREAVAVTAVRAAIRKSRSSAPLVVAAVSKAAPEVAAPVSRAAAEMEAAQADTIASAAIGAAPHAKNDIVSSVHQGVYGVSSSSSFSSSGASSASPLSTSAAPTAFIVRGDASTVHGGHTENRGTPINLEHGGEGDGRFPTHPPFVIPPGHDPNHHGRPDFVDYTKPRGF